MSSPQKHLVEATRASKCAWCGFAIEEGEEIAKLGGEWLHSYCWDEAVQA